MHSVPLVPRKSQLVDKLGRFEGKLRLVATACYCSCNVDACPLLCISLD